MQIIYRKANKNDISSLYELGVLLNKYNSEIEEDMDEFFWEGWEQDILDETKEDLENPENIIMLAEDKDKKALGYVLAKDCKCSEDFFIDQLFVKSEHRGLNIGKALIEAVLKENKEDKDVALEVYKTNKIALDFYKKLGFKEDGIVLRIKK